MSRSFGIVSWLLGLGLVGAACMPQPPTTDEDHEGYQQRDCFASGCHIAMFLPIGHRPMTPVNRCASCHGGNGACVPFSDEREHSPADDCVDCHGSEHDFVEASECAECHYALEGTRDCRLE